MATGRRTQQCEECGESFDMYQYGACPHARYEPDVIKMLEFNRDHPSYSLKHSHVFSGITIEHNHYVHRGVEWDEQHHRHPIIAERCAAQAAPLYPKDDQGFSRVAK